MERKFGFSQGEYYHIYSRGIDRRDIFKTDNDYERFVALLYAANSTTQIHLSDFKKQLKDVYKKERGETFVDIGCYCLMRNHFHILIREKEEQGISTFISKLLTGYSMFFNKKYQRSGSLFVRPFRAEHADSDEYLKYLFSYIHLNPIKAINPDWKEKRIDSSQARKFLSEYQCSSYLDYVGTMREQNIILNKDAFPKYFPQKKDFLDEMQEWITLKE